MGYKQGFSENANFKVGGGSQACQIREGRGQKVIRLTRKTVYRQLTWGSRTSYLATDDQPRALRALGATGG